MRILLCLCTLSVLLAGCGRFSILPGPTEPPELTLADLAPVDVDHEVQELPQATLEELAAIYRDVLSVTDDPATRMLVLHRLADIELLDGEANLAASESSMGSFTKAIDAYETLIRENPDNPLNDQLIYQLSKAYELSGDPDKSVALLERLSESHPDSKHFLEAEFRKAESYFVAAKYAQAEQSYFRVIDYGPSTPYYVKSQYMHGWSQFKQRQYRGSIASFTATLDELMPRNNQIEQLARGERELAEDCLRVLAVVFSYLEGAETIAAAYDEIGVRPYQHLFYEALGEHYLKQERYRDSAETYKGFTTQYPDSKFAHLLQLRVVESYEAGGFPDLIVEEKKHYVELFGVSAPYWRFSNPAAKDAILPKLKMFIRELASYHHALAQDLSKKAKKGKNAKLAQEHYAQAGDYYQLFVDSFPTDDEVPDMGFLLAESRLESGAYRAAITAFEWVAYEYNTYDKAADAAYSAILAYGNLIDSGSPLQSERIDSELKFSNFFEADPRAPAVLGHAANSLLEAGEYQLAIRAANKLSSWDFVTDTSILSAAWLVLGHSYFELEKYQDAEESYQSALADMPEADKRRNDTVERVAASIYKQAEESVARKKSLLAAEQFSRVMELAPNSSIRVNAQFDAANNYMAAGDFIKANEIFVDFRARYPKHALTPSIAAKLVGNYEQLEQWGAAAQELDGIHSVEKDAENKRQSLYLAAQYYDKASSFENARLRYRSYAHEWPQPVAIRMEAMNRLAELYVLQGDEQKRRFWLRKILVAHDEAGEQQSERSRYLAAMSSNVLAADEFLAYSAVKLRYPIKRSLKKKKAAMQRALSAFEKTNDFGVAEFSTSATYYVAKIYQQLSSDLIQSERPKNIDALALEQYEILLEEQAFPFEEKAISIHESNFKRAREGVYDQWVKKSFVALGELLPARYSKQESLQEFGADGEVDAPENPYLVGETLAAENESARLADAGQWFRQRMKKNSNNLLTYNQYAIFLREQGRFPEAERTYLHAISVRDTDSVTHRNLGILYDIYLGEQVKALRHFNRYQILTGGADRKVKGWIVDLQRQLPAVAEGA